MNKIETIHIKKVVRITCPRCGELQVKLYPLSSFTFGGGQAPNCIKCINELNKKALVKN